jgi:hypothetical protein
MSKIVITIEVDETQTGRIIHITPPEVEAVDPPEYEGRWRMSESSSKWLKIEDMHPCHLLNALQKDMKGKKPEDIIGNLHFQEMFRVLSIATLP